MEGTYTPEQTYLQKQIEMTVTNGTGYTEKHSPLSEENGKLNEIQRNTTFGVQLHLWYMNNGLKRGTGNEEISAPDTFGVMKRSGEDYLITDLGEFISSYVELETIGIKRQKRALIKNLLDGIEMENQETAKERLERRRKMDKELAWRTRHGQYGFQRS